MNKMVVFHIRHPVHRDVYIKGVIDADYLFGDDKRSGEGIIQYYQGEKLRWRFPVNPFMLHSIKWNQFNELVEFISEDEEAFAFEVFKDDESVRTFSLDGMIIQREVLTW